MESGTEISEIPNKKRSWSGFWSGLIWVVVGIVCVLASQFVAGVVVFILEMIRSGSGDISNERGVELLTSGDVVSFTFLISLPLVIAMLAFAVKVRRKEPFFEFLGVRPVAMKSLAVWILGAIAIVIANGASDWVLDRPAVPPWMVSIYNNTTYPWLFFISLALLAPLLEELLYRGYTIRVWSESVVGPIAGTILLSLLWAATHIQYDLYNMMWIFILGVLLCSSRLRTNSIIPSFSIHVGWNTASIAMLLLYGNA